MCAVSYYFLLLFNELLLHFLQSVCVLCFTMGFRRSVSIIWKFPALLITPVFSLWTMGPINSSKQCCHWQIFKGKKLGVSYFHTWINIFFSIIVGIISFAQFVTKGYGLQGSPLISGIIVSLAIIIFYLPTTIFLILIQTIDNCKKCCCSQWCITHCLPITNRTILDTDKMDELIVIQECQFQEEDIQMSQS